jgi:hypothetical protein
MVAVGVEGEEEDALAWELDGAPAAAFPRSGNNLVSALFFKAPEMMPNKFCETKVSSSSIAVAIPGLS